MSNTRLKARSAWRNIVLPAEHGGWGFLFEPILLGLLAAFSWAGIALSIAAISVFLAQQPLKIALKDRLRGKRHPRTALAERFVMLFALIATLSGLVALLSASAEFLMPLLIAVPLALLQVVYAARNRGREAIPEISGALALGASAPMIGSAGGMALPMAFLLWLVLAARAIISIMYVRVRLRRARQEPARIEGTLLLHSAAFISFISLWQAGIIGVTLPIAFGVLLARAAKGLLAPKAVATKVIGFSEIGLGILVAILAALAL
ncbi:MAG: prenyltransferase [Candidatus Thermofonsia Clade 1 bacterium]|uniref:Prenyltransferase n=1 Tax=Candidatus Thermofonsia Clade 1 bacterium TaxID=2364210 RepID=A0A2M8PFB7_9CHLR|nr:MAG: prenyltransferase [Candidatus Thermofonsia Clade 1 bacterium]RMF53617.1 MAG: prenyltransferase [Chloroflexota bacterium]